MQKSDKYHNSEEWIFKKKKKKRKSSKNCLQPLIEGKSPDCWTTESHDEKRNWDEKIIWKEVKQRMKLGKVKEVLNFPAELKCKWKVKLVL